MRPVARAHHNRRVKQIGSVGSRPAPDDELYRVRNGSGSEWILPLCAIYVHLDKPGVGVIHQADRTVVRYRCSPSCTAACLLCKQAPVDGIYAPSNLPWRQIGLRGGVCNSEMNIIGIIVLDLYVVSPRSWRHEARRLTISVSRECTLDLKTIFRNSQVRTGVIQRKELLRENRALINHTITYIDGLVQCWRPV